MQQLALSVTRRVTVEPRLFLYATVALRKGNGTIGFLVRLDPGERDAGVIVDTDLDELPAHAATVALAGPITGDAVTDLWPSVMRNDSDICNSYG